MSKQAIYGFPCVTDPRDFSPDAECSSPEERAAHKRACETFGTAEYQPNRGCYSEHDVAGNMVKHVTRTSWGIGANFVMHCDECNTPDDETIYCHDCARDLCAVCWPLHERKHEDA